MLFSISPGIAQPVALRLAGGLHMLVLCNKDAGLTSVYPPNTPSDDALWTVVRSALRGHVKFLLDFIKLPPQTNEIRRSSVMIGASHLLADRFGLPMVLSELGASGGLNLLFDRYQLIVREARFGARAYHNPCARLERPLAAKRSI